MQQRAEQVAVRLEPDLIYPWGQSRDPLTAALDILLSTAQAWRRRFRPIPLWAAVNFLAAGMLITPTRR